MASAARWRVDGLEGAYRLRTGSTTTLVLPARAEPYTVADLSMLIPQSFTRQDDGAYVLSENVVVLAGATLALVAPEGPEGLDIRLESRPEYFTSIVALGGSLTLAGSETADVRLTSWDSGEQAVDTSTADGRAYVRILGGHAALSRANLSNLGFWSGNTGGLALTGSDEVGTFQGGPPDPLPATDAAAGAQVLPEEALAAWAAKTQQDFTLVTAGIDDVTIDGNAFGLFVSNARDIVIEDSAVRGSLVDGIVLHRAVTDARISRTTASDNAVDGFTVGSSTTRVVLKEVTAAGNGRNGISLDGRPLAEGPNAVGTAVESYGGNRVTESTVEVTMPHHIPVALLSYPTLIPDRTAFLLGETDVNPAVGILEVIAQLERLGCQVIGIPCHTAHAPAIWDVIAAGLAERGSGVRLLHMVEEVGLFVRHAFPDVTRVGVLSTAGTQGSGVYAAVLGRYGLKAVTLEDSEHDVLVHASVYDPDFGIKAHASPVTERARASVLKAVERARAGGAEVVVLACTELPLAVPEAFVGGTPVVDCTEGACARHGPVGRA